MKQMAVQQTAFQACLQSFLEATNKRFDDVVRETARDAAELKASLQFTQNEVDNIKKSLHEKSDVLDDVVKRIEIVASVQHEIENVIDYLENQPRRNNLRIDGVAEGNADTWADTEGNADTWADTEGNANTWADTEGNADTWADTEGNADTWADTEGNADTWADTEGNADTWAATEGNTDTWADTEAAMRRSFVPALNISENQARDIRIERAHRMTGNSHSSKPRTVSLKASKIGRPFYMQPANRSREVCTSTKTCLNEC